MAEELLKNGISSEEDRALGDIDQGFHPSDVPQCISQLRTDVADLHAKNTGALESGSDPVRSKPHSLQLAQSLVSVIQNREPFPSEEAMKNLHHWSNAHGIVCTSHQETVAAILQLHIALADDLARQYADGKPHLTFQSLRNKARDSAARAVWLWDPATGELEMFLRQDVSRGLEYYEKHGPWRVRANQRNPTLTRSNTPVQSTGSSPLRAEAMFPSDREGALHQWAMYHRMDATSLFTITKCIAKRSYGWVFRYAAAKNPGQEIPFNLKKAAHASLFRSIKAFHPRRPEEEFDAYAQPLVCADIDRAWTAMQEDDAVDEPHPRHSPNPNTRSRLAKRRAAAALKSNHQPSSATMPISSSATAATESSDAAEEQLDAAGLAESIRQALVTDYVQKQETGGGYVHSYVEAVELLIQNNRNIAKTDAIKILSQQGMKKPKAATACAAVESILRKAAESFAPPNSTQKYFRGFLRSAIENGIKVEHIKHR